MNYSLRIFTFLIALLFTGCRDHQTSKPEIKQPSFVEMKQPSSLTALSSAPISFTIKSTDGSTYTAYNQTMTIERTLSKSENCPGNAYEKESLELAFISGVATLEAFFDRPGSYKFTGSLPELNLNISGETEVESGLPFEFTAPESIKAGQLTIGKVKKSADAPAMIVQVKWLKPSGLDTLTVPLTDGSERELALSSPLKVVGEAVFQISDSAADRFITCRLNILSGRIRKVELKTNSGSDRVFKFFDEYDNPFMGSAFMSYSIVRASDSKLVVENVSWVDGRGYRIPDQLAPGDYSIKMQFKERDETALGIEIVVPFQQ